MEMEIEGLDQFPSRQLSVFFIDFLFFFLTMEIFPYKVSK